MESACGGVFVTDKCIECVKVSGRCNDLVLTDPDNLPGADKPISLARPGREQAAPVKSVMGRGMD